MKYVVHLTTREFEITAQEFDFDRFYGRGYDQERKLGLTREAWQRDVPLYLHDIGVLDADYLATRAENIVTREPVFAIFDKEDLTFTEMLREIQTRAKKIVKKTPGDEDPYA